MSLLNARLPRLALLAAVVLVLETGAGFAQTSGAAALCVYQDQGYSEGATVCPQTRFMLMCSAEGARLVWKPVADRALAERCVRPTITFVAQPLRRQRIARTLPAAPPPPAAGQSEKCFVFGGKRYCE